MAAARTVRKPALSSIPRSALDSSLYGSIDAVLKDLRSCSRRLTTVTSSMTDELQLLERLYYKGQNQHRAALFWRKVSEMRRFGQRVTELQLPSLADSLRYAFYADDAENNRKTLRGSWSQAPGSSFVLFVLERSQASCQLVDKARSRLTEIYKSFMLLVQTGAFLQLALTLAAIVSRLDILMDELGAALQVLTSTVGRLFATLNPENLVKDMRLQSVHREVTGSCRTPASYSTSEPSSLSAMVMEEMLDEDLGSSIIRPVHEGIEQRTPAISTSDVNPVGVAARTPIEGSSSKVPTISPTETGTTIEIIQQSKVPAPPNNSATKRKVGLVSERKKKKPRKDEIDEIFGSF